MPSLMVIHHFRSIVKEINIDPFQPTLVGNPVGCQRHAKEQPDGAGTSGQDQRVRQPGGEGGQARNGLLGNILFEEGVTQLRQCGFRAA